MTNDRPAVCPLTVRGRFGSYNWPCTRAAGHDGDCTPQIDEQYYSVPLDQHDKSWLVSELRLQIYQRETTEREWMSHSETLRYRWTLLTDRLYTLTGGRRKTVSTADVRAALDEGLSAQVPTKARKSDNTRPGPEFGARPSS